MSTLDPSERDREMSAADLAQELAEILRDVQGRYIRLEMKFRAVAQKHDNFEDRPASVQYGWGVVQSMRHILEGGYALAIDIEHMAVELDKETK